MTTPPTRTFSPEIQALRALAVTLVVLFHVWPERLRGGYVGVDVFFVISGFLITGHLWRERVTTGTVNLLAFWARRIRRLLPAAALVLVVALLATLPVVPIQRYPAILQEFWSSIGLFENWTLAASAVNYFDAGRSASPFQHYWSLSVEEQLYLVWPVLLVVVMWLVARVRRSAIPSRRSGVARHAAEVVPGGAPEGASGARVYVALIGAIGVASFVFSIVATAQIKDTAYFSTFTHVWEFTLGALLSFAAPHLATFFWNLRARLRQTIGAAALVVGVALIVVSAVLYTGATPFPGWLAVVPAAGAFLVILSGVAELPKPVAALVAWRPVDFLGAISYSLYLWHWPVLTVVGLVVVAPDRLEVRVAVVAASVVLAWLTKRFVEDPARKVRRPRRSTLRTFVMGAAVVVVAVAISIAPASNFQAQKATAAAAYATLNGSAATTGASCIGAGAPLNPQANACPDSHDVGSAEKKLAAWLPIFETDHIASASGSESGVRCIGQFTRNEHPCAFGSPSSEFHIEIVGDSHALQWANTIVPIALREGWYVTVDWHAGCGLSVPGYYTPGGTGDSEAGADCQQWSADTIAKVAADSRIDVVVMSSYSHKYAASGLTAELPGVEKSNEVVMKRLVDAGRSVIVMADPPLPGFNVPYCVSVATTSSDPCTVSRTKAILPDPMAAAARELGPEGVTVIDTTDLFCDAETCHTVIGGLTAYQDSHHLSSQFLITMAPVIEPTLQNLAAQKGA